MRRNCSARSPTGGRRGRRRRRRRGRGGRRREGARRGGRGAVVRATPATWAMLLQAGWRNAEGVRLLCGGEALSESLKEQLVGTGAAAWNLFGPTETTVWSTVARLTAGEAVTIGRPIAN